MSSPTPSTTPSKTTAKKPNTSQESIKSKESVVKSDKNNSNTKLEMDSQMDSMNTKSTNKDTKNQQVMAPTGPTVSPMTGPVVGPVMVQSGLDYLGSVDQLLIKQKIELIEAVTGCETRNRYVIENNFGQKVFNATEISGFCDRFCCGQIRPLDIEIMDNFNREVIYIRRPLRCQSWLCFCCLQEMTVEAPKGNLIGSVHQDCTFFYPAFHIENSLHQTVFRIQGPLCPFSCCCNDVHFDVLAAKQDIKVAKISKLWSGCCRENFTDADFFSVSFPLDLDVTMKALLISAAFLIDYMYFESP